MTSSVTRCPTFFPQTLYNTLLQHLCITCFPALLSNTLDRRFSTTVFWHTTTFPPALMYKTSRQHSSATLLYNNPLQHLCKHSFVFCLTQARRSLSCSAILVPAITLVIPVFSILCWCLDNVSVVFQWLHGDVSPSCFRNALVMSRACRNMFQMMFRYRLGVVHCIPHVVSSWWLVVHLFQSLRHRF